MRKGILMIVMAGCLLAAGPVLAGVSGSAHDLRTELSIDEICVICHTPHNAVDPTANGLSYAPLWNHEVASTVYTLYTSSTLDHTPGQPDGATKLCLSCHDGSVAIDNYGGTTTGTIMADDAMFDGAPGSAVGSRPRFRHESGQRPPHQFRLRRGGYGRRRDPCLLDGDPDRGNHRHAHARRRQGPVFLLPRRARRKRQRPPADDHQYGQSALSDLPRQMRPAHGRGASILRAVAPILLILSAGCATAPPGESAAPVFFPAPPAPPRVQYLTHFTQADQIVPSRGGLSRFVLGDNKLGDEIAKPYGVLLHEGKIYVCDTKLGAVLVFDLVGGRFGYLGTEGPGRLRKPLNLCAGPSGQKFVADANRGEIVVLDREDRVSGALGSSSLLKPVDVAFQAGRLYVCDAEACQIVVLDAADGTELGRFGDKGMEPGHFARPTNLALDTAGNIYVSDTLNGRIQVLSGKGEFLRTFGTPGDRPGNFARPKGVAVDQEGRCYVVDAAFENVQVFDPEGRVLMDFGGSGEGPGRLYLPAQVVIDTENLDLFREYLAPGFEAEYLVLVTSQYGPHKVSVFAFGRAGRDG